MKKYRLKNIAKALQKSKKMDFWVYILDFDNDNYIIELLNGIKTGKRFTRDEFSRRNPPEGAKVFKIENPSEEEN